MERNRIFALIDAYTPFTLTELLAQAEKKEADADSEEDCGRRRTLYEEAVSLRRKYILNMRDDTQKDAYMAQLAGCLSDTEKLLQLTEGEERKEMIDQKIGLLVLLYSTDLQWDRMLAIGTTLSEKAEHDLYLGYRMDALEEYHRAALILYYYAMKHTGQPGTESSLSVTEKPELALTDAQKTLLSGITEGDFISVFLSAAYGDYSEVIGDYSLPTSDVRI